MAAGDIFVVGADGYTPPTCPEEPCSPCDEGEEPDPETNPCPEFSLEGGILQVLKQAGPPPDGPLQSWDTGELFSRVIGSIPYKNFPYSVEISSSVIRGFPVDADYRLRIGGNVVYSASPRPPDSPAEITIAVGVWGDVKEEWVRNSPWVSELTIGIDYETPPAPIDAVTWTRASGADTFGTPANAGFEWSTTGFASPGAWTNTGAGTSAQRWYLFPSGTARNHIYGVQTDPWTMTDDTLTIVPVLFLGGGPVIMTRTPPAVPSNASPVNLKLINSSLRAFDFVFEVDSSEAYSYSVPAGHDVIYFSVPKPKGLTPGSVAGFLVDGVEIYTVTATANSTIEITIGVTPDPIDEDGTIIETLIQSACEYPAP